nr:ferritin-like domain-containing protein [candidate division Zixibacteria bacterium]
MEELTLHKSLQLAAKTEQLGAEFYEKMARKFSSQKDIAEIFSNLSKDEKIHEAQFRAILDKTPIDDNESNYEVGLFVKAIAISEFFRIEQFKRAGDIKTADEALGAALAFEKSTLLYYQELMETLGDSDQLRAIIKAEKGHIMSLTRLIVTDAQFRGIRDNW